MDPVQDEMLDCFRSLKCFAFSVVLAPDAMKDVIECTMTDKETSECGFFVAWSTFKFYLPCSSRFIGSVEGRRWVGLPLLLPLFYNEATDFGFVVTI